jgi:hypothetical protein
MRTRENARKRAKTTKEKKQSNKEIKTRDESL